MVPARAEAAQPFNQLSRSRNSGAITRVSEYANEPVFRNRTGGPSVGPVIGKPVVDEFVMDVIGIEEGHQKVDVEERRPTHTSSLRSLTSFIVGRRAPLGLRGSSGTPLRTRLV